MPNPGRFRFSLARVLNVRETEHSIQKQALARANAQLHEANAQLDRAFAERDERILTIAEVRSAAHLDISLCLRAQEAVDRAEARIAESRRRVAAREREREAAAAAYAESYKKVRSLERLREIRRDEHAQERKAHESKTADEVASSRSRAFAVFDDSEPVSES